ncbi:FixH family protein [Aquabacterium sp.]|uniref:FixH family protein n=1 Tax=Aquabacterium sp. TaxID=1872578 RepID=UPI003783A755
MNRRFALTAFALTLLASTAGCMSPPTNLDLSLTRPTLDQKYVVTLQPPATPAALHQLHRWQVKLATPAGVPVAHARILVDGGMPQHGHGLPTRPQVTQELADGTYVIDGMKFSMTGWWEIKLAIDGAQGSDKVTFNTVVVEPGAGR